MTFNKFIIKSIFLSSCIALASMLPSLVFAIDSSSIMAPVKTAKSVRPFLLDQGVTGRLPMNGGFIIDNACPSGYTPIVTGTLNRSGGSDSQDDKDFIVGWGLNWITATTITPSVGNNKGRTQVNHSAYTWYQDSHGNESWGGIVWQLYCRPS